MKLDFAAIAIESAGLAAGSTAAMFVYKEVPKLFTSLDQKWVPFVALAAGALAPRMIGKKNEIILNVGRGMVARAGSDIIANALGLVSGVGAPQEQYFFVPDNQAVAGVEQATI